MTFQDANGEPVLSKKSGYYGWEAEYDQQGNKIISTYLGKDGKPMPGADGYATLRMAYDSRGDVIRVTFHGANGEAVKSEANGYDGWEAETASAATGSLRPFSVKMANRCRVLMAMRQSKRPMIHEAM